MKAYLNQNGHEGRRGGFTVVEILIVITVIAILAAMLIPVVGGAMRRANEFAIQTEMTQLDMAIEQFKTDNGFYPPSFTMFADEDEAIAKARFLQLFPAYLNRIAPNHAENQTTLGDWWDLVGSHFVEKADTGNGQAPWAARPYINPGSDLVFWLSGIAKNKQYPLTSTLNQQPLANYPANDGVERNVYFDFSSERLSGDDHTNGLVATYLQPKGKQFWIYVDPNNDKTSIIPASYMYLDSDSYGLQGGYCLNDGSGFFNQTTFQLAAPGLDGAPGASAAVGLPARNCGVRGMDNIVNFVNEGSGKLETKALGIN